MEIIKRLITIVLEDNCTNEKFIDILEDYGWTEEEYNQKAKEQIREMLINKINSDIISIDVENITLRS